MLEFPGEQPGWFKASGHAPFLDQAESALDRAVVFRRINRRALVADGLIPKDRREPIVHELGPVVRSEAFKSVTDVGQEFRRCRGHLDRTLVPEGVEPSHAWRHP